MKSKTLFFIPVCWVCGALLCCGFVFLKTKPGLFFLVEGAMLAALALFVNLYRKLIKPYRILADSVTLIKEQDFSSRLRPIPHSEANKLIEVFNKMMDQLRNERLSVREKNRFLDLLIQASPQGVIILDFDYRLTSINPSGCRLLGIKDVEEVRGRKLSEADNALCRRLGRLEPGMDALLRVGGIAQYRCTLASFIDRGASHPFILIEELTNELLAIEKESYESLIRMMAHEVNNSAGAINATLNVLEEIASAQKEGELAEALPALKASSDRCVHLSRFVSNLADVVKIPEPQRSAVNINALLRSVCELNSAEFKKRNIRADFRPAPSCLAFVDKIQFEQVFVNLIKNACEAIGSGGTIRIVTGADPLVVAIENNGEPLTDAVRQKLFTPFFTTKNQGRGIGLMFVREALMKHDCRFGFYSRDEWTIFRIEFP